MRTTTREVKLADGGTRHVVTVMDVDDPDRKDVRRSLFLTMLADNEAVILRPAGGPFERATIRHDGIRWVAEAEAVEGARRA